MENDSHPVSALSTYVLSVTGRRSQNEDIGQVFQGTARGESVTLLLVADGMGGHAHGEVASSLAASAMESLWRRLLADLDASPEAEPIARAFMDEAFVEAELRIAAEGGGNGMGTTLVAALLVGDRAMVANLGDSRAYVVRASGVERITNDHSVVEEAVRAGTLTQEEAEASPYQHALTRALNGTGNPAPDLFPARGWLSLGPAAVLVLCSDGLSGAVGLTDFAEHFARTPDVASGARSLAALALERGTPDNVTIAAAEVGALPRQGTPPLALAHVQSVLDAAEPVHQPELPPEAPPVAPRMTAKAPVSSEPPAAPEAADAAPRRWGWWLSAGIVIALLTIVAWRWMAREARPAPPRVPVVRGHARPVPSAFTLSRDGDALRWRISGLPTRDDTVRILVSFPADTLTRTLTATGSRLPLARIADAWPGGRLLAGEYVWRVEARSLSGARLRSGPRPLVLSAPITADLPFVAPTRRQAESL